MTEPLTENSESISLNVGTEISVSVAGLKGRFATNGRITYIGRHHFKVRTEESFPRHLATLEDVVTLRLISKESVLPITTRFVRLEDKDVVLRTPIDSWRTNRRRYARLDIAAKGIYIEKDDYTHEFLVSNISGGGLLASSTKPPEEGSELLLRINLPSEHGGPVLVRARVLRTQGRGESFFAARFLNIESRDRNRVCRLVIVGQLEQRRESAREITGII